MEKGKSKYEIVEKPLPLCFQAAKCMPRSLDDNIRNSAGNVGLSVYLRKFVRSTDELDCFCAVQPLKWREQFLWLVPPVSHIGSR